MVKSTPGTPLTPVQKLLHLAEVEGFRVQFTDYPKVKSDFFFFCCKQKSPHKHGKSCVEVIKENGTFELKDVIKGVGKSSKEKTVKLPV